jgi:hypothetical protein
LATETRNAASHNRPAGGVGINPDIAIPGNYLSDHAKVQRSAARYKSSRAGEQAWLTAATAENFKLRLTAGMPLACAMRSPPESGMWMMRGDMAL